VREAAAMNGPVPCRVCEAFLAAPDYCADPPAMTSLATHIDVPTRVWVCRACGHVQSPDLPDIQAFYGREYRISLQSDDHDQLYATTPDGPLYRTEHQARLVASLEIPHGGRVLDFGAAKATTLRRVAAMRPDIHPHVFDVSDDYRDSWRDWVPAGAQATHELPADWLGRFDLVTAHFVLEHVANPVETLTRLRRLLAPGGRLFFTVPDPIANPGDMIVVDHLNHFVPTSIAHALRRAGLCETAIRQDLFTGAHAVLCHAGEAERSAAPADTAAALVTLETWKRRFAHIAAQLAGSGNGPVAIYGAGFYGLMFASLAGGRAVCHLDRNPHLQGTTANGLPVLAPEACPPAVRAVVVGLNPTRARDILPPAQPWLPVGARIIYPDDAA
jgi:SAM-dependent methyltransferase